MAHRIDQLESIPQQPIPDVFHIPCPNGHTLETLPEMLGKLAMCPTCGEKFKLDRRNSIEFLAAEDERQAEREALRSRRWLRGAIVAVVLTLLGVLLLFLVGSAFGGSLEASDGLTALERMDSAAHRALIATQEALA